MSELSSATIRKFMYGSWVSQAVYTAVHLRLPEHLATGPGDIEALAASSGTDPDMLYRLMRALASVGVFSEDSPRHFVDTELSECLRTDAVKDLVHFFGNEVYRAYGRLADSVRTGDRGFDLEFGTTLWERMETVAETGDAFRKGMGASSWREQLPLPATYDFGGVRKLVDVGGGEGSMLAAVLHENPSMSGVLVEIPAGIDRSMKHFQDAGVAGRTELVEASAFDELPVADGYFMSCVLHVMDDESSLAALRRIRESIEPGGRLVILERIVGPGDEPGLAMLLDLTMMVMNGGRERTEQDWQQLLKAADFKLTKLVPMPYFSGGAELFAIEATPVD
jgi:hypothetical protein